VNVLFSRRTANKVSSTILGVEARPYIPLTEIYIFHHSFIHSFIHFPVVPNLEHRAPFGVSVITHTGTR
jgi:hypothetical protein